MKTRGMIVTSFCAVLVGACATGGGPKDPCGLVKTETDPFAGPTRGFVVFFDEGRFAAIAIKEQKGTYEMTVMTVKIGDVRVVGSPGDVAEFILGGESLTLQLQKEAKPVANANMATVFTQWQLVYAPTRDQVARFGAAPLTAMKLNAGSEVFQFNQVVDKVQLKLQNSARCMAS